MIEETPAATGDENEEAWDFEKSSELYGVPYWGAGYFSVGKEGNLRVHPRKDPDHWLDLKDLVDQLGRRGITTPVLIRFSGILKQRLVEIHEAFRKAAEEAEYDGKYMCVLPIKVNQQSHVIHEYLEFAKEFGFGAEAGSKPELIALMALVDNGNMPIICNGFKDDEFIETVILATKIGKTIIPVIENFAELRLIVKYAEKHGIRPRIGARVKLASRGVGRWESSAGIRSKFGLTIPELLKALDYLKERDMADCLQLLHFHLGSQVSNIRNVKGAISEAAHIYAQLKIAGAGMQFIDVGGGLGIDYDGSRSVAESSINYSLEEYANDIVFRIKAVCDEVGVPHPTILSESGRAMLAYHSMLIMNVLGRTGYAESKIDMYEPNEEAPQPLRDLYTIHEEFSAETWMENYHDAIQAKEDTISLFNLGYLSLEDRALAESLFWSVCEKVQAQAEKSEDEMPEDIKNLSEILADTYFCNFSLFQSIPDSWAINQLFPIMPIHRLDEEPTRRGIIADITCDSDGKVDQFVTTHGVKKTLELHPFEGDQYHIGVFLLGAYQEILGDLHNLLGDTNAVHIEMDDEDEPIIKHLVEGDTVSEVLSYVQFDPKDLIIRFRTETERAVKERRITPEEAGQLLRFYIDGMNGYTYLEEPQSPSVLSQATMPERE